ncbi:hypothetical protein [Rubellimicrobium thermophilum]|uniref:hypothetical protein n=1 Tax=Rubellimicrobium thermophilum TaxID=295419 RepID=UPI00058CF256|nr:hypothetical protein [Rubellimicrobium thermophilum]
MARAMFCPKGAYRDAATVILPEAMTLTREAYLEALKARIVDMIERERKESDPQMFLDMALMELIFLNADKPEEAAEKIVTESGALKIQIGEQTWPAQPEEMETDQVMIQAFEEEGNSLIAFAYTLWPPDR